MPQTPVATFPVTPSPQVQTPVATSATTAPLATPTTNTTTLPGSQPQPVTQNTTAPTTIGVSTAPTTPQTPTTPLTMPASGSVVDLLNAAGQDSSYGARQQLASKYGIQGYTGTAQQNTDLSQKYLTAFNNLKGTTLPQNSSDASSTITDYLKDNQDQADPQQSFFDAIGSMDPVEKSLYDTINQTLSSVGTQQTFTQQYQDLVNQQGIPALQTSLMNVNNVMNGTEDDIRNEITKAGGFATDSQVQALTAARNKTLIQQAGVLQTQLQQKEDYVNQIMQFSQADQAETDKNLDTKIGLQGQLSDLQDKMVSAAKDNYNNIVNNVGYSGLAESLQNNPQGMATAESILGLPTGALSDPTFLADQTNKNAPASVQEYQFAKQNGYTGSFTDYQTATGNFSNGGNGTSGGSGTPGSLDTTAQAWLTAIQNGNATMTNVPAAYKNEVAVGLANTDQTSYSPLAASRFSTASNKIVSNFIQLPQYQLTANGLPYLQRIDAAIKNPGSVSDQDLLDSLTKLNTAGNAISDAQVKIITDGQSFSDMANVLSNKLSSGGVLSNTQRTQIQNIANAIYANYAKGYQPVYDQITQQLQDAGIPSAFWTIPDLNNLAQQGGYGSSTSGTSSSGSTTSYTSNGVTYLQGADGLYYPSQ